MRRSSHHTAVGAAGVGPFSPAVTDLEYSFAFQPIVDAHKRRVMSFEALVRGPHGEPSSEVFSRVPMGRLHSFDQACRVKAIHLAARLSLDACLNLNFLPHRAGESGEYLRATLTAARDAGIPVRRLVFEIAEAEFFQHAGTLERTFGEFSGFGFRTAVDDFGSGFSGLRRLVEYQPDFIKLDRDLVTGVDEHRVRQIIVRGICDICRQLAITVIAEGVETVGEYRWLRDAGIHLFQGYYFGPPVFEALPVVRAARF